MASETDGDPGRAQGESFGTEGVLPAMPVIQRFGGIRPMAQKLGVPVSTVQGWKERGVIPSNRREEVLGAAARHGIVFEPGDLTASAAPPIIELGGAQDHAALPPEGADSSYGEGATALPPEEPTTATLDSQASMEAQARVSSWPEQPAAAAEARDETFSQPRFEAAGPAPARGRVLPAIGAAALTALLISGTAPYWTRALGLAPQATPEASADLGIAVQRLETRLGELENQPQPAPGAPISEGAADRLAQLEQLNQQLRSDLDRLAGSVAAEPGTAGAPDPALGQRLEAVSGELTQLRGEIDNLRRTAGAVAPERLTAIANRAEENAAELRAMQGELSSLVDLPQQVRDLAQRIEAAAGQTDRTAFVLAAGQLEAALDAGQPFASELGAVRRLAAEDQELAPLLDQLQEQSDEGIPTLAQLRARFEDMALAAAQAATTEVRGGWADRALARLRSVVTVRPVGGDVAGDAPEARLARAEARLEEGDLAAAVAELEGLQGTAAEASAPWLADARARVAADQAIERLRERALARITANGMAE